MKVPGIHSRILGACSVKVFQTFYSFNICLSVNHMSPTKDEMNVWHGGHLLGQNCEKISRTH